MGRGSALISMEGTSCCQIFEVSRQWTYVGEVYLASASYDQKATILDHFLVVDLPPRHMPCWMIFSSRGTLHRDVAPQVVCHTFPFLSWFESCPELSLPSASGHLL